jgi:hypothetical protein
MFHLAATGVKYLGLAAKKFPQLPYLATEKVQSARTKQTALSPHFDAA